MTLPASDPSITYDYTGPGDYTFSFIIFDTTDVEVNYQDPEGLVTQLTNGVDYTISEVPEVDGGTIHATYAPVVGTLQIRRIMIIKQDTDWVNNDPFSTQQLEDDLDKIYMILQQIDAEASGGVYGPIGMDELILPPPDAGKALKWNDTEDEIINSIYNVDEQLAACLAAQQAAEEAAALAQYYANVASTKVDTVPVGTIIGWVGGYFTDGANGGYTKVLDVSPASIREELEIGSFRVCDGTEFFDADSPIFNVAGRHLPNLTDDRWLQGTNEGNIGTVGGSNTVNIPSGDHTHNVLDADAPLPDHSHSSVSAGNHQHSYATTSRLTGTGSFGHYAIDGTGAGIGTTVAGNHNHSIGGAGSGTGTHNHGATSEAGGAGGVEDNRPKYLNVVYAMKVKVANISEGFEYFVVQKTI